jgi:thymidylate synthase ThyX
MQGEIFTPEEERLLSRYVTNLHGNVFVLKNLPEVIKGALFSRYSRSPKGLRRLLLDEFISNPEIGLALVEAAAKEDGADPTLAVQKAEAFYDRILDGYGDDSVAELGGVHVAFENISNIATKVIEDARIGGSPLEKSSRYVLFNKKVNGDYLFYKEPVVLDSKSKQQFMDTMHLLFNTYDDLSSL